MEDAIVDIGAVERLSENAYWCISCGGDMIPVIGEKRRRHFRHKVVTESCSLETYLHKSSKYLFLKVYKDCLTEGIPYEIQFYRPKICKRCTTIDPCTMQHVLFNADITKHFKHVYLESKDGQFIPDLLLSSDASQKIYVEIAVKHFSSSSKLSSENKIIEIKIENEDDLSLIRACRLSEDDGRIEFINFERKAIIKDYSSECNKTVPLFILNPNGSSTIKMVSWFDYEKLIKNEKSYYKVLDRKNPSTYKRELEKAHLKGLKIHNCFLCRYHGKPTARQHEETGNSIFCKFLKSLFTSNEAVKCKYYRADQSVFRNYKKV
ncbi:MAG: hypothetical protein H8D56_15310 [Planctomycetes bacterium]|nr:hypothetical protein [Planctomycetota bacterium]MBL7147062.1 hypothetical protein [Phycisphaerae bacterium]